MVLDAAFEFDVLALELGEVAELVGGAGENDAGERGLWKGLVHVQVDELLPDGDLGDFAGDNARFLKMFLSLGSSNYFWRIGLGYGGRSVVRKKIKGCEREAGMQHRNDFHVGSGSWGTQETQGRWEMKGFAMGLPRPHEAVREKPEMLTGLGSN
jgi:hypothetical protein